MISEKKIFFLLEGDTPHIKKLRCKLDFDINLSKNKWRVGRGRMYLETESRDARDLITYKLKILIMKSKIAFEKKKVYVGLYVIKPNMRSDALNMIDGIMDSVKTAINVDDRWFSISKLDWEVSKKFPCIYLTIMQ